MTLSLGARTAAFRRLYGAACVALSIAAFGIASDAPADETGKLSLEQRVQRLEDESIIRWKLQDYMRLLQSADWDEYVKMFATDGKLDIVEGVLTGRAAIKTRMANASARMAKAREGQPVRRRADLLSNVEARITGPNTAKAQSRFTFLGENENGEFMVTGSGLYTDEWVREDGEWRIGYRSVKWDLLRGESARASGNASK